MKPLEWSSASCSEAGGRAENQDAVGSTSSDLGGCWVVADGLGGHRGGAIASSAAIERVMLAFDAGAEANLDALVAAADAGVKEAQAEHLCADMRTTLALLVIERGVARWAHVGDTRIYRLCRGRIADQSADHSVPQLLVRSGEIQAAEIRHHPERARLLRALGQPEVLKPALGGPVQLERGDAFLLCTDGWWELVLESEMEADHAAAGCNAADWLSRMQVRILTRAAADHDNYSAVTLVSC